ncbi:MAG: HpcH/HpaI aldolase/citrate lyase family protein, partial [Bacilli bacterium]|nr:HpcH/HpaI aldolase/citrate lyase family protein [Bacilli bacterium]
MKYFNYINSDCDMKFQELKDSFFYKYPINLDKETEFDVLKYSLGAFLYIPAIQEKMLDNVLDGKVKGLSAFAVCLEDSVGENGEKEAIENLERFLRLLNERVEEERILKEDLPFIFIRPKNESNLSKILPIIKIYKE